MTSCIWITVACSSLVVCGAGQQAPDAARKEKLEFIAKTNASSVARIRTLDIEYTRKRYVVHKGGKEDLLTNELRFWWWKDGARHRVKFYLMDPSTGAKSQFVDSLIDGSTGKFVSDYDWEKTPPVPPGGYRALSAQIDHGRAGTFYQVDPMVDLMLRLKVGSEAPSLSELLEAVEFNAQLSNAKIETADGIHAGYELKLQSPKSAQKLIIFVDPDANYLIRRYLIGPTKDDGALGADDYVWTVERFKHTEEQVCVPEQVVVSTAAAPGSTDVYEVRLTCQVLRVNEPIAPGVFDFQFPENAVVRDNINGVNLLWGKGQPVRSFRTQEEAEQMERDLGYEHAPSASAKPNWWASSVLWVTVAAAVVLGTVVAIRIMSRATRFTS